MDEIMFPYKIEITVTDPADELTWRMLRIHRLLGYAQALADISDNEDYYKNIKAIDDSKGSLTVTWWDEPSKKEKEFLQTAWDSIISGYEGSDIYHDLIDFRA